MENRGTKLQEQEQSKAFYCLSNSEVNTPIACLHVGVKSIFLCLCSPSVCMDLNDCELNKMKNDSFIGNASLFV